MASPKRVPQHPDLPQVEVVYEVTVQVGENEPIPEEHIMGQAILKRFPEITFISVERR